MNPNEENQNKQAENTNAQAQTINPFKPQTINPTSSTASQTPTLGSSSDPKVAASTLHINTYRPTASPTSATDIQNHPVVSGPVVGGIVSPGLMADRESGRQNPLKFIARFRLLIIIAIAILFFGGGGAAAYFGYFKDAEMNEAMKVSDAFLKALDEGDEVAMKANSDFNPRIGISSVDVRPLAEALSTDLVRHKEEYSSKDGKKRALASYEVRTKLFGAEIVRPWVNLLEKRQGKWVVVNVGSVKDKNSVKLSDFTDKVYSGDEDILYVESESQGDSGADIERQTDIKALHGNVEAFYAQNGFYPSIKQINDPAFRSAEMRGLDDEALQDPDSSEQILNSAPNARAYAYQPKSDSGSDCNNEGTFCTTYILTATLADGTTYTKEALN